MGRLITVLLAACLSLSAVAADAIKGERKEVFGDITVHYNTFNSTFLTPDIAKAAELIRSKNQGVINVSVIKDGKPLIANVTGTVKDLTSQSVPLNFRQVTERGRSTTSRSTRWSSRKPAPLKSRCRTATRSTPSTSTKNSFPANDEPHATRTGQP